ncbi:hypothetical protein CYMTET_42225 [Cymbomonas tetramitiformis]|uniref:Uncharacterized protein n=1 Tax=Cymbomonas tetramitiformis TaxID=36881 RepID=A0AAE0F1G0_9CHLO|nr:hypothetical protein CYMTET_42228 [Cymbomonas tetramitiformis]KAK3248303.1 hypothetical protein CYMTET_42225 [Cymbomonas tetramitiformis]
MAWRVTTTGPTFLAVIKTAKKAKFDMKTAKFVAKKCLGDEESRFQGDAPTREDDFGKIIHELESVFVEVDAGFASLFNLNDVTPVVRKEANELRSSAPWSSWRSRIRRLQHGIDASAHVYPWDGKRALLEILREVSTAGAAFDFACDFLDIRFESNVDPQKKNADFNTAAHTLASRRNTFDPELVKRRYIAALDPEFYAAVRSRLRSTAGGHCGGDPQ